MKLTVQGLVFYGKFFVAAWLALGSFCAALWAVGESYAEAWVQEIVDTTLEAERGPQFGLPPVRYAETGHSMGDGAPGARVPILWTVYKIRECGRALVHYRVINGHGLYHNIPPSDISALDNQGRGIGLSANPTEARTISYYVTIPADVEPGRANIQATLRYPDCPDAPAVYSPVLAFRVIRKED